MIKANNRVVSKKDKNYEDIFTRKVYFVHIKIFPEGR